MNHFARLATVILFGLALIPRRSFAQSIYEPYTFGTLAGYPGYGSADGMGAIAQFHAPAGMALDRNGNIYVADARNNISRKITPAGVVTTLAGDVSSHNQFGTPIGGYQDGVGGQARFNYPLGVAIDQAGNVFVADAGNQVIRKVTANGAVTTLAGDPATNQFGFNPGGYADGLGSAARFQDPIGVATDDSGNVYVADSSNNAIRKITSAGVVTTLAGLAQFDADGCPVGGSADGTGKAARFSCPSGLVINKTGNIYVADGDNRSIRKITPGGLVATFTGLAGTTGNVDGTGTATRFGFPSGMVLDDAGNLYVADPGNSTVRKVTPNGVVTTLAGQAGSKGSVDGPGNIASFNTPWGIAATGAGDCYVSDQVPNTIRKVTAAGVVTTIAGRAGSAGSEDGTAAGARFSDPLGVVRSAGSCPGAPTTWERRQVCVEVAGELIRPPVGVAGAARRSL